MDSESGANPLNDAFSKIDQKKLKLTDTLKRYIYGIKLQESTNIMQRDMWSMLTRSMPSQIQLDGKTKFNQPLAQQNMN